MKAFAAAAFILSLSLFTGNALAQNAPPPSGAPPFGDYKDHLPGLDDNTRRRPDYWREPKFGPSPEPRVLKKGPLAPSPLDREAYALFLKQPDSGLIRLLPAEVDRSKSAVKSRPKITGGGAFYSFTFLSHDYVGDLKLDREIICQGLGNGKMVCQYPRRLGVGLYGMMTDLGEVDLDSITATDARVAYLLAYEPPRAGPKVRCEKIELSKGITVNGQLYKDMLPAEANHTYLLRATDHWQSDVLVAFRVIRDDEDESVTIAWKLLKKYTPLKIERVLYVNSTDICPTK